MAALPIHPQYEPDCAPERGMLNILNVSSYEPSGPRDEVDRAVYAIVSLHAVVADDSICIPQEDFSELIAAIALYVKTGVYPHL